MRALTTRGSTLFEMMIVLVIAVMLAGMVTGVVTATARAARRQTVALNQQRSEAALSSWWRADLRDTEIGDVALPADDKLLTHHPVGAGAPCLLNGSELWIARKNWVAGRDPESGRDELWLLVDAGTATWVDALILAAGSGSCPDGRAALRIQLDRIVPTVQLVRAVEPLQLRLYRSGSLWWFGLAPADGSSPVQPFAGPVVRPDSRFAMDNSGVHVFVQPAAGGVVEFFGPLPLP